MGFTSNACWFWLIKTLLIKNNKKREAALRNEAGGDEKHVVFFLLDLTGYSFTGKCLRLRLVLPSACFAKGHDADCGTAVVRALALHQCGPGQNLNPVS